MAWLYQISERCEEYGSTILKFRSASPKAGFGQCVSSCVGKNSMNTVTKHLAQHLTPWRQLIGVLGSRATHSCVQPVIQRFTREVVC